MKINKTITIAVLLCTFIIGGVTVGVLSNFIPLNANASSSAKEGDNASEADGVEETGDAKDYDANKAGEDEEVVSPDQAAITADEAKAAAEKAYPGAKATKVELEKDDGVITYEVDLDNGFEVLVDSTDGHVLSLDTD